ncbi:MAG: diacylglycerol kinase, partial [Actinomycetales bacterium]|nr:diacylglycerol kinase [Actinomycetales bacterium]
SLFGKVILQGIGVRRQLPASPGSIEFWRAKDITVRCDRPEPVQVDGDLIGEAVGLTVRIQPGGLLVRTKS